MLKTIEISLISLVERNETSDIWSKSNENQNGKGNVFCLNTLTLNPYILLELKVISHCNQPDQPTQSFVGLSLRRLVSFWKEDFSDITLTMPNFINGIIHLPFLALSIIIFRDIKMRTLSWSANSILVAKANHFWFWQDKD